jgi:hypothetical protein
LEESVPRVHPAEGAGHVGLTRTEDMGHAAVVVLDLDGPAEPRHRELLFGRELGHARGSPDSRHWIEEGAEGWNGADGTCPDVEGTGKGDGGDERGDDAHGGESY